jgi:2Fe-2S ferredoxin
MDCVATAGQNLLDLALKASVSGMLGQCGGAINCATCLVEVGSSWVNRLQSPCADEVELLSYVDEATTTARLACQLVANASIDGIRLRVITTTKIQDLQ